MSKVKALGYIGCTVTDAQAWEKLLVPMFGLEHRKDSPAGVHHYRMDEYHHRLVLKEGKKDKLDYIGWELETREDLQALVTSLKKQKVEVKKANAALCEERKVMELHYCKGPDNVRTELYFGMSHDYVTFSPGRGISGFNTGEYGLGHIVLTSGNREKAIKWYREKLGFLLSDHIFWDGIEATFLHCNPRHHSLALTNPIPGTSGGDVLHFMFELNDMDDVGQAYDMINAANYPLAMTLGRHTNDRTTSFYVYSPSGWWVEYGYGGHLIDDEIWEPKFYNSPKIWGHEMLPPPGAANDKPTGH